MNLKYYLGEKSGPVKTAPTGPAPTPMYRCGLWCSLTVIYYYYF